MITYTSKRNREHHLPKIFWDYNLFMGGVDLSDMHICMFLDKRRTVRWNKKVFFTLLGRLILNSLILYQQNTNHEKKLNRHNFMIQLVEGLIGDYWQTQIRPGRKATDIPKRLLNPETHMKQTKLPKRKKKKLCYLHKPETKQTSMHILHLWWIWCSFMYRTMLGKISH